MRTDRSADTFGSVPDTWFEPVIGLWVLLFGAFGMTLTLEGGKRLLGPLGTAPLPAVLVTTLVGAFAYGVFGLGVAYAYLTYRGVEPGFVVEPFDHSERRWIGGLGVLSHVVMAQGGVWFGLVGHSFDFRGPMITIGSLPLPDGWRYLDLSLTGVNDFVDQAPTVLLIALLTGLLVGPSVGALIHGVLQTTLTRVAPPAVAVGVTALAATVLVTNSAFVSTLTLYEAISAVVTFGFVLGVAYAYWKTENLLLPMAAYGLFNVIAAIGGWLSIVVNIYAAMDAI